MNLNPDPGRIYCPHCGEDGMLSEEVTGYFRPNTTIYRCPYCHSLIEDYCFDTLRPSK